MDPPHMAVQKNRTTNTNTHSANYVRIRDVCPEDLPRAMNDREKVAREGQGYPCYQHDYDDDEVDLDLPSQFFLDDKPLCHTPSQRQMCTVEKELTLIWDHVFLSNMNNFLNRSI